MDGFLSINSKYKCCGCRACEQICVKSAITMKEDFEGFLFPQVNKDLCNNCGLCKKVCQFDDESFHLLNKQQPKILALRNIDPQKRLTSSSGGVFCELANTVIKSGGYVAGAEFTTNYEVIHTITNNLDHCERFRTSKYSKSELQNMYSRIKNLLLNNKKVLFSGTPCQVSGLYAFLNKDYEKLITCDIICHGVPSPLVFRKYLDCKVQEYNSKITQINFKDKKIGWRTPYITISFSNGKSYSNFIWEDTYGKLYHSQVTTMRACHECKYTSMQRQSDITIGDFWGMTEKHFKDSDEYGTSIMLINSDKGLEVFNSIKENFKIITVTYEDAKQPQLQYPPGKPNENDRNQFFKLLDKYPYTQATKKFEKRKKKHSVNIFEKLNNLKGRKLS